MKAKNNPNHGRNRKKVLYEATITSCHFKKNRTNSTIQYEKCLACDDAKICTILKEDMSIYGNHGDSKQKQLIEKIRKKISNS